MARIGIKLADGSFFPIIEDETRQRKRMILTVASPGQSSAQIDLLRYEGETQQYVGCLVLDELSGDGTAELELVVGLDEDGTIDARVNDSAGEQYQSLSVNIRTLEGAGSFSLPDDSEYPGDSLSDIGDIGDIEDIDDTDFSPPIEMGADDLSNIDLEETFDDTPDTEATYFGGFDDDFENDEFDSQSAPILDDGDEMLEDVYEDISDSDRPARSFSLLAIFAVVLIGLSVAAIAAYLVFRWLRTDALPELRAALVMPMVVGRLRPRIARRKIR